MALMAELKRRRVFRVAAMYGFAAWVITEVSATVFPALFVPDWAITFVVVILITGFPLAMFLAWVFDIGPDGIVRTAVEVGSQHEVESGRGRVIYTVLLVAGTALLTLALYHFGLKGYSWLADDRMNSIAVLPFDNMSNDPGNDYFSDGISEELLNLLAKIPNLQVAARTSSFAYRGEKIDAREVGRNLGVATVLEGSVRWSGDERIRITAQLIDVSNGFHLWSETYDRELKDIFEVQDDISRKIVDALKIQFVGDEQPALAATLNAPPTGDLQAYQYYLEARHKWRQRGGRALTDSIELFQKALALDPSYARAASGLAAAYVVLPGYSELPVEAGNKLAQESVYKALALDATLAEAHSVLALINVMDMKWSDAESDFFNAISLDPNEATTHQWYSLMLLRTGRLQKALEQAMEAHRLEPDSPIINLHLSDVYLTLADNEKALFYSEEAERLGLATNIDPIRRVLVYMRRGKLDEAQREFANTFSIEGDDAPDEMEKLAIEGIIDPAAAAKLVQITEQAGDQVPLKDQLRTYVYFGEPARALAVARKIVESDPKQLDLGMVWSPESAALRAQAGFPKVLDAIGLVDYWQRHGWSEKCQASVDGIHCT
jgi:TolB-like protein